MKNISRISTLTLATAMLAVVGCSSYSAPTVSTSAGTTAYVSSTDPNPRVQGYSTASSSNTSTSTVNGPSGDTFIGVATDASGNLYTVDSHTASGSTTYTVNEYAAGSNSTGGAVTATMRTFTSAAITTAPVGITVDNYGNIFVSLAGGVLLRFAAGSSGAVSPSVTLTGLASASASAVATDTGGNLYATVPVSLTDSHSNIAVFASGYASGTTPVRVIIPSTEMDITALAAANGNVYATGKDINGNAEVAVFAATATGSTAATTVISGAATTLKSPGAVQVDGAGNIFVGDSSTGAIGGMVIVDKFASSATGNVAPTTAVTTSQTVASTSGLAVH